MIANRLTEVPENEKVSTLLLYTIGDDCLKFYENLPLREDEKDTVDKILDLLERNLVNEVNVVHERGKLMIMRHRSRGKVRTNI